MNVRFHYFMAKKYVMNVLLYATVLVVNQCITISFEFSLLTNFN